MNVGTHPKTVMCDCTACLRDDDPAPAEWSLTDFSPGSRHDSADAATVASQDGMVQRQDVHTRQQRVATVHTRRVGTLTWDHVEVEEHTIYWAFVQ